MTKEINCFHPDYVKTHMAHFINETRKESRQTKAGHELSKYVEKKRIETPSHGTVFGISKIAIPVHRNRPKDMMVKAKSPVEITEELIKSLKTKGKK